MSIYGPTPLNECREPPTCSTVVAADGTGTYRRTPVTELWVQVGGCSYTWQEVISRIGDDEPCWTILPEIDY